MWLNIVSNKKTSTFNFFPRPLQDIMSNYGWNAYRWLLATQRRLFWLLMNLAILHILRAHPELLNLPGRLRSPLFLSIQLLTSFFKEILQVTQLLLTQYVSPVKKKKRCFLHSVSSWCKLTLGFSSKIFASTNTMIVHSGPALENVRTIPSGCWIFANILVSCVVRYRCWMLKADDAGKLLDRYFYVWNLKTINHKCEKNSE